MKNFRITPVKRRVAVLTSGGLDSSVLLAEMARRGRDVFPIYMKAGLVWERTELRVLGRFIAQLGRSNIAPLTILEIGANAAARDHWSRTGRGVPGYRAAISSNYLPGRNLNLLTSAAIFCAHRRIGEIAMALLESNPFPDARPDFFRAFERTVALGVELSLKITMPFLGMEKEDVIRLGRKLPLALTLTCASPVRGRHCGKCTKCAERIEAFKRSGVPDPTSYAARANRQLPDTSSSARVRSR
jgi:7-cyano-7-deazaguanine synthase